MQWFKNIIIYQLNSPISLAPSEIESSLKSMEFIPCGQLDKQKMGWVAPLGEGSEMLTHTVNGQTLLCARKEEKMLPASAIKQHLAQKIQKLEDAQHRKLTKTEKASLKDEVINELLPRAFSRVNHIWLWIDTHEQRIIVNATSAKKAEDVLSLLRKCIGSLPAVPFKSEQPISTCLTQWVLTDSLPEQFILEEDIELKSAEQGGAVVKCKNQDIMSDEITTHIKAGKFVTKIGLNWQDRIQFILCDDGTLKRIQYATSLLDENKNLRNDTQADQNDADFVLMNSEISSLINILNSIFK